MIGIGITTWGDRKTPALEMIRRYSLGRRVIKVDIHSISKAKNECLKQLDECDDIFLFDDDVWPLCNNWHLPYINSGEPHLSMTWGRKEIGRSKGLIHYEKPNGCMLYINRKCLDVVGGFDEGYTGYAGEHQDFSNRVFNAGLTTSRYMDIENSSQIFHSMDQHKEVTTSVIDRHKYISANMKRLQEQWNSKEFKAYK